MPKLQTSGGLCYFLQDHLGHPIPSPALFTPMHDRFVTAVKHFAQRTTIPADHVRAQRQGRRRRQCLSRASTRARAWSSSAWRKRRCGRSRRTSDRGPGRGRHLRLLAPVGRRQSLLLLRPRSRVGPGVRQDRHLSAVSDEALSQRPRVGESNTPAPAHPLRESRQRLSRLCRPPRACKRSATRWGPPTCRPSSIAGRSGCRGR